jgi:hypothetical protein
MKYRIEYQDLATNKHCWYIREGSYPSHDEAMRAVSGLIALDGPWAQRVYRVGLTSSTALTHMELVRLFQHFTNLGAVVTLWFGGAGEEAVLYNDDEIAAAVPGGPVRRGSLFGRPISEVVRDLVARDREAMAHEHERVAMQEREHAAEQERERVATQERERAAAALQVKQRAAALEAQQRAAAQAREQAAAVEAQQRATAQERARAVAVEAQQRAAAQERARAVAAEAQQRAAAQERQWAVLEEALLRAAALERERLAKEERERVAALEAQQRAATEERERAAAQERERAVAAAQRRAASQERERVAKQERERAAAALEAQQRAAAQERERLATQERERAAAAKRNGETMMALITRPAATPPPVAAVAQPALVARNASSPMLGGDGELVALAKLLRCGAWREGMRSSELLTAERLPVGAHGALQELVGTATLNVRALGNALKRIQDKRIEGSTLKLTRTIDNHGFAIWQVVSALGDASAASERPRNAELLRGALTGMGYGSVEANHAVSVLRARIETEPLAVLAREALGLLAQRRYLVPSPSIGDGWQLGLGAIPGRGVGERTPTHHSGGIAVAAKKCDIAVGGGIGGVQPRRSSS